MGQATLGALPGGTVLGGILTGPLKFPGFSEVIAAGGAAGVLFAAEVRTRIGNDECCRGASCDMDPHFKVWQCVRITGRPVVAFTHSHVGPCPYQQTWTGEWFDFHGQGDLVFISNPEFNLGLGLDVHIRTTVRYLYSYIGTSPSLLIATNHYAHLFLTNCTFLLQNLLSSALAMTFSRFPAMGATCLMVSPTLI